MNTTERCIMKCTVLQISPESLRLSEERKPFQIQLCKLWWKKYCLLFMLFLYKWIFSHISAIKKLYYCKKTQFAVQNIFVRVSACGLLPFGVSVSVCVGVCVCRCVCLCLCLCVSVFVPVWVRIIWCTYNMLVPAMCVCVCVCPGEYPMQTACICTVPNIFSTWFTLSALQYCTSLSLCHSVSFCC